MNKPDINDINERYLNGLNFHFVDDMSDVIEIALSKQKVKNYKEL